MLQRVEQELKEKAPQLVEAVLPVPVSSSPSPAPSAAPTSNLIPLSIARDLDQNVTPHGKSAVTLGNIFLFY